MAVRSVDVTGLLDLSADLVRAGSVVVVNAQKDVRAFGKAMVRDGRGFAPKRTGYLASTISDEYTSDGLGVEVGPTAEYGGYVERGTSHMPPQPYMEPALQKNLPKFEQLIEKHGGEIL